MNLKQHVCSLELAKRLKELGIKKDSLFWYWNDKAYYYASLSLTIDTDNLFSAYTASELLEMLLREIFINEIRYSLNILKQTDNEYDIRYWTNLKVPGIIDPFIIVNDLNLSNAIAKMLIWLIENGHLKPEDVK